MFWTTFRSSLILCLFWNISSTFCCCCCSCCFSCVSCYFSLFVFFDRPTSQSVSRVFHLNMKPLIKTRRRNKWKKRRRSRSVVVVEVEVECLPCVIEHKRSRELEHTHACTFLQIYLNFTPVAYSPSMLSQRIFILLLLKVVFPSHLTRLSPLIHRIYTR